MYHSGTVDYPDEPLHVRKYLGPAIDLGPAMTAKIHQRNGRPLTVEEQDSLTIWWDMVTFRENTEEHLGAKLSHNELEEVGIPNTPEYVLYTDDD